MKAVSRALPPMAPAIQRWSRPYTPGLLTKEQHTQFYEDGYVPLSGLLQPLG